VNITHACGRAEEESTLAGQPSRVRPRRHSSGAPPPAALQGGADATWIFLPWEGVLAKWGGVGRALAAAAPPPAPWPARPPSTLRGPPRECLMPGVLRKRGEWRHPVSPSVSQRSNLNFVTVPLKPNPCKPHTTNTRALKHARGRAQRLQPRGLPGLRPLTGHSRAPGLPQVRTASAQAAPAAAARVHFAHPGT
jgi:hypothetical protein